MRILTLDGRLGNDAELKTTKNGKQFIRFSIANTTSFMGKDDTVWYDIISYHTGALQYLKKGIPVNVSGVVSTSFNVDKGKPYINHTVIANSLEFSRFGNKKDTENDDAKFLSTSTSITNKNEVTNDIQTNNELAYHTVASNNTNSSISYVDDDELPF